jgi:anti-sigma factor RsiW
MTNSDIKLRFLRAMAFEIRRKRPPDQAMAECIEKEGQRGKHRALRPASVALETDGFVAAMKAAGLIGEEAAVVLATVAAAGDHRLLASAISSLADYHEQAVD